MTSFPSSTPLHPRKRAILVGASGGIGSALAHKLADNGYSLALFSRDADAMQKVCNEINVKSGETRALAFPHDVTQYETIPASLRKAIADLGGLDTFVYVAGYIYFPQLNEFNFEQDRRMVEVNLLGAMAWMDEVAALFQAAKGGQIVGVSSVAGDRGRIGNPGYNTSKSGFTTYLEALRNRLTRHGVNVITVKPGMVKTEMLALPNAPRPVLAVTAEKVADDIYKAILKRKQVVYTASIWMWVMMVIKHVPSAVFRRLNF